MSIHFFVFKYQTSQYRKTKQVMKTMNDSIRSKKRG